MRQVSTAVGDGATAATAAERYIEEQEDFRRNVIESEQPVLLGFWNPEYNGSLDLMGKVDEANLAVGNKYKFLEFDVSRKKGIAKKYDLVVDSDKIARVIEVNKGELVRELDLNGDLKSQM